MSFEVELPVAFHAHGLLPPRFLLLLHETSDILRVLVEGRKPHVRLHDIDALSDQMVARINPSTDRGKIGFSPELVAEEAFNFPSPAIESLSGYGLVVDRARNVNGNIVTFPATVENGAFSLRSLGVFALESLPLHENKRSFGNKNAHMVL